MRGVATGLVLLVAMATTANTAAAGGCPCPKQKMAETYGNVGTIHPQTSPLLPPPVVTAQELALRHVTRGDLPRDLPLATPATNQVAEILALELASAE
jgi:hypothetical protein